MLDDVKANNFDFLGDLDLEVRDEKAQLPLFATPFELTVSRQVALPKGQPKSLDSVFFLPQNAQRSSLQCKLSGRSGRTAFETPLPLSRMPSYQYHFVVLARIPEQYGFLDRDRFFCVKPFSSRTWTTI